MTRLITPSLLRLALAERRVLNALDLAEYRRLIAPAPVAASRDGLGSRDPKATGAPISEAA